MSMSTIITALIVIAAFTVSTFAVLCLMSLPIIVRGWRQKREDEFALAEMRTAELKAARHRNHT